MGLQECIIGSRNPRSLMNYFLPLTICNISDVWVMMVKLQLMKLDPINVSLLGFQEGGFETCSGVSMCLTLY